MIRVLHYGLSTHLGGIETYLYKLSQHINRKDFQFDFLVSGDSKGSCFYKDFISMGSKFYSITPRNEGILKSRKELIKLFTTEKFDIVHCHMNSLSNILPITLALKYNIPVIVHSRNGKLSRTKFKTKLLHEFNSLRLPKKRVHKLAVSDLAGEWMFGKNADFTVINNGIDIKKFQYNEITRGEIRKELGLNNEYCIIHVGAFRRQKNHMFLLEIFKEIVKVQPNSKLLLIGSGRLKSEIKAKIHVLGILENVLMIGNTSNVSEYLSASDVFLFPSLFEGFPNAVLEAQTSGLPCLISDTITKEVLINCNCYQLSLYEEPREWANKLLAISKYENRINGSKNIRKQGFSVEDEVKKIEKKYMKLLDN